MADRKIDMNRGLGDIDSILHNQGVADLSWLAVDEADYRAAEALPKQNLDIIPELQRALSMDGESDRDGAVPQLIPMRPHTVVNRNPLESQAKADLTAPIRNRVARLVMAGVPNQDILGRLRLEFASDDIRAAADAIRDVLADRGLLGNVYVDASHFPNAASDPEEKRLARTLGKNAMFVIGGCGGKNGCNCHETGMCSTFGSKRVVSEVPYGANVASYYAPRLIVEKRPLEMGDPDDDGAAWKRRLQAAFLKSPLASMPDGVKTVHTQQPRPAPAPVSVDDVRAFVERRRASDPLPSPEYVRYARRMQSGHDDRAFLTASTDPSLRALAAEYGLLGHTYVDVDVAGGCRQALALVRERGLSPDFVVRRSSSCSGCGGAPDGACDHLCRTASMVGSKPQVDRAAFGRALKRAADQGRMSLERARTAAARAAAEADWPRLTALVNLYSPAEAPAASPSAEYSGIRLHAHNGDPGRHDVAAAREMDPDEVRRSLSHLMNTGLSGRELQAAILQRYSVDDLRQVPEVGRTASVDDGVQGRYFVDPTAYLDYGRGCHEGSAHFRKRGAPYVLASSGCNGCTLQTAPGWCSKYAKGLIRQVPTEVRERVASAKRALPVIQSAPVTNPVEEYELRSELAVDSSAPFKDVRVDIPSGSLGD